MNEALTSLSARNSIIVCGALLDATLERSIRRRLKSDHKICERLFDPIRLGPLGPYTPKVDVGYLLGVYGEKEREALKGLGFIRNAIAHSTVGLSTLINSNDFKKAYSRLTLHVGKQHYPRLEELDVGGVNLIVPAAEYPDSLRGVYLNNYRSMQHTLILDQFYHAPNSSVPATPVEVIKWMDEAYGSREAWLKKSKGLHVLKAPDTVAVQLNGDSQ